MALNANILWLARKYWHYFVASKKILAILFLSLGRGYFPYFVVEGKPLAGPFKAI